MRSDLESIEQQCQAIQDLQYYYGDDKEEKRENIVNDICLAVEPLIDHSAGPEKGRAIYAKGYALSWTLKKAQAEELLAKAVKLDPSLHLAWNRLGEMCCEAGDSKQAITYFETAIDQGGQSPVLNRNLSITLRGMLENRAANFSKGLQYAKDAVTCDVTDPLSWETLGNSFFGEFFLQPCPIPEMLSKVLQAYDRAEKFYSQNSKTSATLHRNRGVVYKFMENYSKAIVDFRLAAEKGGTEFKDFAEEAESCFGIVRKIANLCASKGRVKLKKLQAMQRDVDTAFASLDELEKGENEMLTLSCNVYSVMNRPGEVPMKVICHDRKGNFFCLSIYNCDYDRTISLLRPGEGLSVSRSVVRTVTVDDFSYLCVRCGHPGDLNLRGQGSLGHISVGTAFNAETVGS